MKHKIMTWMPLVLIMVLTATGCARMGHPDGGWFDDTPPYVVSATPADRGTNAKSNKVTITFNEYIKLENASEKVVISPPQKEQPTIKASGKYIYVTLEDTLLENTTYTIDFSDAISDNNEGNPMGNYAYSFSTGSVIDTMEVSGTVLNAEDLEPIKGILVGLYPADADSIFGAGGVNTTPFARVARSDSRGRFVIRGVAPGRYVVGALNDMDGDFMFTQRGEKMAFSHEVIVPSFFPDHRQDTVWLDDNHIKDIVRIPYTHFMPDNIVLRVFEHEKTDRYFLKYERLDASRFTLFFTAPISVDSLVRFADTDVKSVLPTIKGLNFNSNEAFLVEPSMKGDTVTYWLRDTALINQDTLAIEMTTLLTDTAGCLQVQTDTLEVLAKTSYAKRLKAQQKIEEEWKEKVEKARKRAKEGEPIDSIMPMPRLKPVFDMKNSLDPDATIHLRFDAPMAKVDTAAVHLYVEQDSLWYKAPFTIEQADSLPTMRRWNIYSDWIPGANYSLEVDTLAFEDIYGLTSEPYKTGLTVAKLENYASLFVNVKHDTEAQVIVQILNTSGKVQRTAKVENGTAEFYYLMPGNYYLSAFVDMNGNGVWDTGDYFNDQQPEPVFYNPEQVECKAKWDITREWNLTALPLDKQKPEAITKQKGDKAKKLQDRNAKRAADKGLPWPPRQ